MNDFIKNIHYIIDKDIPNELFNNFIKTLDEICIEKNVNEYFSDHSEVFNCNLNIHLMSKSNLDTILPTINPIFKKNIPTWLTGITTDTRIYMVLSSVENNKDNAILALHEIIHYLSKQIQISHDSNRYLLLEEGLSTYICSQMTTGKFSKIVEDYNTNSLRSIQSLLNTNESIDFANNNGYYYSFFFMKFLKNNYYKGKIFEYIIDNRKLFRDLPKLEKEFKKFIINQIEYYNKK